jgi:hypothetical protein
MNKIWHGREDEIYYVLYREYDKISVICLRNYDKNEPDNITEHDYNYHDLIKNSEGKIHAFSSENDAIDFLNDKFDINQIDDKYTRKTKYINVID